jgi:ProP effector
MNEQQSTRQAEADVTMPTPIGKRKQRQRQIIATIAQLAERYPRTFFVLEKRRKPLKIKIAGDITATVDSAIRPVELRWALMRYCNSAGYLRSVQAGAAQLDLAGNEAGRVTADEADHARQKLDEVLARRQPKPKPAASDKCGRKAPQQRLAQAIRLNRSHAKL